MLPLTTGTPMRPMTREAAEFADLLVADDEWVEREFEALVAFGWDDVDPPTCPASPQGALRPRRPRGDAVLPPDRQGRGQRSAATAWAHERGPPATPAHSPAR